MPPESLKARAAATATSALRLAFHGHHALMREGVRGSMVIAERSAQAAARVHACRWFYQAAACQLSFQVVCFCFQMPCAKLCLRTLRCPEIPVFATTGAGSIERYYCRHIYRRVREDTASSPPWRSPVSRSAPRRRPLRRGRPPARRAFRCPYTSKYRPRHDNIRCRHVRRHY